MSTEETKPDPAAALEEVAASNDEHGTPSEDMECMATMEDITLDDGNYCEFQTMPSGKWHKSLYSSSVVQRLINTQFSEWTAGVRKADCAADLKRRLGKGPPIWVEDKHALPVPEDDTHISRVWFSEDGKEYSAKLKGCVEVSSSSRAELRPPSWSCTPRRRPRASGCCALAGCSAGGAVGGAEELLPSRG